MRFTRIKGDYSEVRRLPRLGKIRLGVKRQAQNGNQYPSETEHFVCPPEVEAVYGPTPVELDVMLPLDDPEQVLVQKFARYGASAGLKCHGNGEQAEELNEKTKQWVLRSCPCDKLKTDTNLRGDCTPQTHLLVLLPKVSMGGCYQITTRSFHSTVGLNSSLDYTRGLAGRIALLPMKLRRVPQETHHDGKKQVHYILSLVLDATLPQIADLRSNPESLLIPARYQIEGPTDENPLMDPVDIIDAPTTIDAAELADMDDAQMDAIRAKVRSQQVAVNVKPANQAVVIAGQVKRKVEPSKPVPEQPAAHEAPPEGTPLEGEASESTPPDHLAADKDILYQDFRSRILRAGNQAEAVAVYTEAVQDSILGSDHLAKLQSDLRQTVNTLKGRK
jgi:hypothetical protein